MATSRWRRTGERLGILLTAEQRARPARERLTDAMRLGVQVGVALLIGLPINEAHGFWWAIVVTPVAIAALTVAPALVRVLWQRRRPPKVRR